MKGLQLQAFFCFENLIFFKTITSLKTVDLKVGVILLHRRFSPVVLKPTPDFRPVTTGNPLPRL